MLLILPAIFNFYFSMLLYLLSDILAEDKNCWEFNETSTWKKLDVDAWMYWSLPYWILDKIKRNQRSCSHVWISSNKDFTVCNNRRAKYLRKKVVIHCWMGIYIISTNIINKFNIVYNNMCVCGFLWKKLFKVKPHKELFEIKPEKLSSKIVNMFSVCYSNRVFVL